MESLEYIKEKYGCPCCGFRTLSEKPPGTHKICPVCAWEDDNLQYFDPHNDSGANKVSLEQARANYRLFGVSDKDLLSLVRKPDDGEKLSWLEIKT